MILRVMHRRLGSSSGLFFAGLALLLALLLSAPVHGQTAATEEGEQEGREQVRIGVLDNFPPFAFRYHDELAGFTIDYVKLLERKTGIDFELVPGTWADILAMFRAGEIEMITALSYTEERTAFTRYTDPYYLLPTVVYTREDSFTYRGMESLKGKTVGVEEDVYYIRYLQQYPEIRLKEIEDTRELMRSLSFGEVDAVVTNINIGNFMIKSYMLDNVRLAGRIDISGIEDEDLRIGVRRELPGLHDTIQDGMNRISAAEYKDLQDRWAGFAPEGIRQSFSQAEIKLARSYVEKYGGIRLGVRRHWRPVDFLNEEGRHIGIIADIFSDLADEHELSYIAEQRGSREELLAALREGQVDVLPAVIPTAELRQEFSLTKPYLTLPLVAVTRSKELFIGGLETLQGKHIGCVDRGNLEQRLSDRFYELSFRTVDSVLEGLKRVRGEEDYAFVGSLPAVAHEIKEHDFYNVKVAGTLEESLSVAAAVRKEDGRLMTMLQKALNSISEDEKERVVDRWLAMSLEERPDYSLIWKIGGVVLVIVALVMLWTRKVQSYNKQITEANRLLEQKNRELERLSITNQLTGLFNRSKIDEELEKEHQRYIRYGRPFSLIMGDIDGFKEVNDTYGHQLGDTVLEEIGGLIRTRVRSADIPGRWGGEEFLIICPETGEDGARKLAEKVREDIAAHHFPVNSGITMSLGAAEVSGREEVEELLRRTDERLYLAKYQGKNRVVGGEPAKPEEI